MTVYNEIHDETGAKRPHYAALEARTGVTVTQPPARLVEKLRQSGLLGGGGLHPIPLVLDEANYRDVLIPGILQRAYALQKLFADIALGSRTIVTSGLLSEKDLRHILSSEGIDYPSLRRLWRGQELDQIRFIYGPDIVRDPLGQWVVLEDNVGCVGGVVNGRTVLNTYLEIVGLQADPNVSQESDLEEAIKRFLYWVGLRPGHNGLYGISGISSRCSESVYDPETPLKGDCLRSVGVAVTQPEELLHRITDGKTRISAVINLAATLTPAYLRLADTIFADNTIPVFGAPCVGLVASKSFHALGKDLISLYFNEPSLINTPHTQLLRKTPTALPDSGILKRTNGCQGTEVFFLDETVDHAARRTLLEALAAWGPCGAVLQERVSRSVLLPHDAPPELAPSVEIRPIVYVYGWQAALVADIVTGRAISKGGDQRGNISRGAQFLPVLRQSVHVP